MRKPDAFQQFEAHERRLAKLTVTLERLRNSIVDTELALQSERMIGEQLNAQRRRFGLLGRLMKDK